MLPSRLLQNSVMMTTDLKRMAMERTQITQQLETALQAERSRSLDHHHRVTAFSLHHRCSIRKAVAENTSYRNHRRRYGQVIRVRVDNKTCDRICMNKTLPANITSHHALRGYSRKCAAMSNHIKATFQIRILITTLIY